MGHKLWAVTGDASAYKVPYKSRDYSSSWTEISFLKSSENFARSKSVIIFDGGSEWLTENRMTVGNSETKYSFEHFSAQRLQSTSANWIFGKSFDAAAKTGLKRTDLGCRIVLKWTSQSHSRWFSSIQSWIDSKLRTGPRYCDSHSPMVPARLSLYS